MPSPRITLSRSSACRSGAVIDGPGTAMEMWACSVLLYSTTSRGSVCSPANLSHAVDSPGFQSPHSSAIWPTTALWVSLPAALTTMFDGV